MNAEYIIITPMRNEGRTVKTTLDSVSKQTVLPKLWVVLDDGSTDGCDNAVEDYAAKHDWIRLVRLDDRGFDLVGKGVAKVLNKGLEVIKDISSDYVCKVDADLDLPAHYFHTILHEMETNKKLGLLSGHPFVIENGKRRLQRYSDFFPSGAARMYRRTALNEIGQFVNSVGWDTVDILRMRINGFTTKVNHDLQFHHMRPMGTRRGYIDGMIRDGQNAYLTGYSIVFFVCRALFNGRYKPYALRTACMMWGFFGALVTRKRRVVSPEEMSCHRRMQWDRLLLRKVDV